jgi:hypothetical protein
VPNLTVFHRLYWAHQNACGKAYYENNKDDHLTRETLMAED